MPARRTTTWYSDKVLNDKPLAYTVEQLDRFDSFGAFLGWRLLVRVYAWDSEEERYRPAPMVMYDTLFDYKGSTRNWGRAHDLGAWLIKRCLKNHRAELERQPVFH